MSNIDLSFSVEAEEDIDNVLAYTFDTWGTAQEAAYRVVIWNAFQRIQAFPEIGRQVSDERADVREHILQHHITLYRYADNTITILRVVNPRHRRRSSTTRE